MVTAETEAADRLLEVKTPTEEDTGTLPCKRGEVRRGRHPCFHLLSGGLMMLNSALGDGRSTVGP
jgi:hypothetical protein